MLILATIDIVVKHHTSGLVSADTITVVPGSTASLSSVNAARVDAKHINRIKNATFERKYTLSSYASRYTWRSKNVKRSSGNAKIKLN